VETLEKLLAMVNEELVLEARELDWGHDVTLNRASLELDVERRLANAEAFAEFIAELRPVPVAPSELASCYARSLRTTSTSS
jgi:hypothetical protein